VVTTVNASHVFLATDLILVKTDESSVATSSQRMAEAASDSAARRTASGPPTFR
jgi:hypothetical protein